MERLEQGLAMTSIVDRLCEDLNLLIHPHDDRDTPVPGFPSGDALVAWAATKDRNAMIRCLVDVLRFDGVGQQLAAVNVLRSLGVEVDGVTKHDIFEWAMNWDGRPGQNIRPLEQPLWSKRT